LQLSREQIAELRKFIEDDGERNGPAFYLKLLPHLVNNFRNFKDVYDQMTTGKIALERAFSYRMHLLFMSPEGHMTRDAIKEALDNRENDIKKQAMAAADAQARQADVQAVLQNPQMLAQMLQNPQMQAMIAQMMGGGGAAAMER
jgi:hypothetical protein